MGKSMYNVEFLSTTFGLFFSMTYSWWLQALFCGTYVKCFYHNTFATQLDLDFMFGW